MVVGSYDIIIPTLLPSLGGYLEEFESHARFSGLDVHLPTVGRCPTDNACGWCAGG